MASLLTLMYTGVTVVREGSGGGEENPTNFALCPPLSTAVLIALSI